MDVETARNWYLGFGTQTADAFRICRRLPLCRTCEFDWLTVEAASIRLDLAVAESAARATVAY